MRYPLLDKVKGNDLSKASQSDKFPEKIKISRFTVRVLKIGQNRRFNLRRPIYPAGLVTEF